MPVLKVKPMVSRRGWVNTYGYQLDLLGYQLFCRENHGTMLFELPRYKWAAIFIPAAIHISYIYIYMHIYIYIDAFLYKFDMISYGITNSRDLWPVRPYGKWRAWHPWHPWPCCRATWAPSGVPGAMVKNGWFITGVYMDHIYIYTYTYNYVYKTRMGRLLDRNWIIYPTIF